MVSDSDLRSVQQARDLVEKARDGWRQYAEFDQGSVDRIVAAAARAASEAAYELAELAVDETGYGVLEHKFIKNKFAADDVYAFIRDMKTVGVINEFPDRKVYEIAEPVGVVAGVVPSTNPTSTAIYKILISLKSRNAVVLSPHPAAKGCIARTAEIMKDGAVAAGLPANVVACMTEVSLEGTQELMSHRRTAVVLATGGMGLVRAAYSSGKPAYGVGPGNVPAYVESSADVPKAVRDILTGKSFDNGTLCCSEQALICDQSIESKVRDEVVSQGGHFLSAEEMDAVASVAVLPSRLANPEIVGKSAEFIAQKAGVTVPAGTRVLVAELQGVGREYPLSIEKLSPILAFYVVPDWKAGCDRCKEILRYGGMGHTLSIHSQQDDIIREFALQKPASRIVANSPATHGAVGFSTGLAAAMTLGCGSYGGNITSDNITPMHLLNVKRLAYEVRGVDLQSALSAYGYPGKTAPTVREDAPLESRVSAFLDQRGLKSQGDAGFDGEPSPPVPSTSPPPVTPLDFVSEEDVRRALSDGKKLPVGEQTVMTPSARELGNENSIFVRV